MYIFNIDISIAAICDIFNIHEFGEFAGGSSFFILLKIAFSQSFVIYDRLFVIYDLLFKIF